MKINNANNFNSSNINSLDKSINLGALDAGTATAILLHEETRKNKEMLRQEKRAAQKDQLDTMRRAADKLREMASTVRNGGLLQGTLGIAGAGLQMVSAYKMPLKAGVEPNLTTKLLSGGGKAADQLKSFEYFSWEKADLEHVKAELDVAAQQMSNRAQNAADFENEAQRLQSSAAQLAEKISEARHSVAMAGQR